MIARYEHGGARIWFDDGVSRELVADTYQKEDREVVFEALRATLGVASSKETETARIAACAVRDAAQRLCDACDDYAPHNGVDGACTMRVRHACWKRKAVMGELHDSME